MIVGFGEISANRCVGYDLKIVPRLVAGEVEIENLRPLKVLSYADRDAQPFELITLKLPNGNAIRKFCVGDFGTTHRTLITMALHQLSSYILGLQNGTNKRDLLASISESLSGRIWHQSKVIVLKSCDNYIHDLPVIKELLLHAQIDISQFQLLIRQPNQYIVDDNYGDILAYNVSEIIEQSDKTMSTTRKYQLDECFVDDTGFIGLSSLTELLPENGGMSPEDAREYIKEQVNRILDNLSLQ